MAASSAAAGVPGIIGPADLALHSLRPLQLYARRVYVIRASDVEIVLAEVDHQVVLMEARTPLGIVEILGRVETEGRVLRATGVHMGGLAANAIGVAGLNAIPQHILENAYWKKPMSTGLSLKEGLARLAEAPEDLRVSSDIRDAGPTNRFALSGTRIEQPVAVAKTLRGLGLSLRKAHDALNRLVEGETVVARLLGDGPTVGAALAAFGVAATEVSLPRPEIKKIRESLGCSQAEFADRFGLELTTLQNWEQGRNALDAPARILLAIIGQFPEVVDSVLSRVDYEARAPQSR